MNRRKHLSFQNPQLSAPATQHINTKLTTNNKKNTKAPTVGWRLPNGTYNTHMLYRTYRVKTTEFQLINNKTSKYKKTLKHSSDFFCRNILINS